MQYLKVETFKIQMLCSIHMFANLDLSDFFATSVNNFLKYFQEINAYKIALNFKYHFYLYF